MAYYYISFATKDKFLGATVVSANDPVEAIRATHHLKINPGGQAAILMIPPEFYDDPKVLKMVNRIVGREELIADGGARVGDLSTEEQDQFDADCNIVCEEHNYGIN